MVLLKDTRKPVRLEPAAPQSRTTEPLRSLTKEIMCIYRVPLILTALLHLHPNSLQLHVSLSGQCDFALNDADEAESLKN